MRDGRRAVARGHGPPARRARRAARPAGVRRSLGPGALRLRLAHPRARPSSTSACTSAASRRTGCTRSARSSCRSTWPTSSCSSPGTVADEVVCPGVRGAQSRRRPPWRAFRERFGWDGPPVRVTIEKRIPVAAGLGGGSADAAATLRLMCGSASGLQPRRRGAADLAMALGADVPSQLAPRPRSSPAPASGSRTLARRPAHGRAAHRSPGAVEPRGCTDAPTRWSTRTPGVSAMAERLRSAWASAESRSTSAPCCTTTSSRPRRRSSSRIGDAIDLLRGAGAAVALVSGSGPTVFGLFAGPGEAAAARDRVAADWDGEAIAVQAAA